MNRATRRRGAVLVAVLACLGVLLSISVAMVAGTAHRRSLLQEQTRVRQAELLIDSAARRATTRLSADADYAGETWRPRVAAAPDDLEAEVVIRIVRPPNGPPAVEVTATLPAGVPHAVRRSDTLPIDLPIALNEEPDA